MAEPHILIATDLSEPAKVAESRGAALAEQLGARVTLMHCFDPQPYVPPLVLPSVQQMQQSIEQEVGRAIEQSLGRIRETRLKNVAKVDLHVAKGPSAASAVCAFAEANKVDWVVVGTHGRAGLRHLLMGSVAEKIVRHAPCSVVVAR